jgi:hypothetical protein
MGLFRRKRKEKVSLPPKSSALGLVHMEWERQRQPSPGAMAYAWETLGLVPFSPIGSGIPATFHFRPLLSAPQPYSLKAVALDGVPTVAGGIMGAPLYNPTTGAFHSSANPFGGSPFAHPEIAAAGYAL